MARNSRTQPSATRRSTLLAAALAICCAFSLAFISTATARREHTKPDPTQPAPAEASSPAASGQAGTESTPPSAPAPAETGAAGTGGHGSSGQGQGNAGKGHGSQGNAPSGTAPPRHDHHGSSPSMHGSSSTPSTSSGTGAQPAAAGQQPSSTSASETTEADASAQAKHKKETKPKHPKEPGKKSKSKSKGSGSGEGETGSGTGTGTGGGSEEGAGTSTPSAPALVKPTLQATSALAAEPTAAAATAAAAPTPAAATGTTVGASGSRATRVPRHAKAARRPRATKARAGVDAFAAAGAAPALATSAAAARKAGARPVRKGANGKAGKPRSRPSPLVTTITKIVNVVPVAVRMLIALLLGLALLLALRSRLAALRARRLERQRVQLTEDVGLLQAALLPVPPQRLGPVGTSAAYQPAAGPGAGGDFYDVFALADGQLAVIVGDVSGHGREALPHTALVRFTLRAYLEAGLSPRDALQTAGAVLERQLGGVFATVVVATYQPRDRVLVYACAGHPPPVVLGWDEDSSTGAAAAGVRTPHAITPVTVSASPPIGVGIRTGTRQSVVSVPGRAQICFYTDGLTEARVGSELFGTERLIDTLAELGPTASAAAVLERVADIADVRPDDMAACLLSIEGDERSPVVLVDELELDRDEALSGRTERFLLACGVERHELAETMRVASAAAGPSGKVMLEARHTSGPPEVTLQREQIAYLHARRANMEVAL
jgi:serine phosphatase RsbU (regulator of sigma subunit)